MGGGEGEYIGVDGKAVTKDDDKDDDDAVEDEGAGDGGTRVVRHGCDDGGVAICCNFFVRLPIFGLNEGRVVIGSASCPFQALAKFVHAGVVDCYHAKILRAVDELLKISFCGVPFACYLETPAEKTI